MITSEIFVLQVSVELATLWRVNAHLVQRPYKELAFDGLFVQIAFSPLQLTGTEVLDLENLPFFFPF